MCTSGYSSFAFVPAGHTQAASPHGCPIEPEPTCVKKTALNRSERKAKSLSSPCQHSTAHTISSGGGLLSSCLCFVPFAAPLHGGKDSLLQPVKLWLWKVFARLNNPAYYRFFFGGASLSVYVFSCRVLCLFLRFGAKALALSAAFSLLRSTAFVVSNAAASTSLSFSAALAALFLFCFFVPLPVVLRRVYRPAIIGTGSLTPQRNRFSYVSTASPSTTPPAKLRKIQRISSTSLSPDVTYTAETSTSDIWPPSPSSASTSNNSCSAASCVHCSCCSAGRRTQTAARATPHSFSMQCCSGSSRTDVLLLRSGGHTQGPSSSLSCLQHFSHLLQDSSSSRLHTTSSHASVLKTCIHAHAASTSIETTFAGDSWASSSDIAAPECPAACFTTAAAPAEASLHAARAASSELQKCSPPATAPSGSSRTDWGEPAQPEKNNSLTCTRRAPAVTAGHCCCQNEIREETTSSDCCRPAQVEEDKRSISSAVDADRDSEHCVEEKRGLKQLQQQEQLQLRMQDERQQRQREHEEDMQQQLTRWDEHTKHEEKVQRQLLLQQERQRQQLLLECPSLREGFRPACWALEQRLVQAMLIGAQDAVRLLPLFNFDFSVDVVTADRALLLLHYLRHRSTCDSGVVGTQQQHVHPQVQKRKARETGCCGCRGIVFVLGGIGARETDAHLQAVCGEAARRGFCCYFLSCLRGIEVPICTRPTDLTVSDDLEAALKVVLRDHCLHSTRAAVFSAAAKTCLPQTLRRPIAAAAAAPARSKAAAFSVSDSVGRPAAGTATRDFRESRHHSTLCLSVVGDLDACSDGPHTPRISSAHACSIQRRTCEADTSSSSSSSKEACVLGADTSKSFREFPEACAADDAVSACVEAKRDACRRAECKKHLYFVGFSMGACIVTNFLGRLGEVKTLLLEQQWRQQKQQQQQRRRKTSQNQQNPSQQQETRQQLKQQQQEGSKTQETQHKEHVCCERPLPQQVAASVSDGDNKSLECTLEDSVSEEDRRGTVEKNKEECDSCMHEEPASDTEEDFFSVDDKEQQHISAAQCSETPRGAVLDTRETVAREEALSAVATEDKEKCCLSQHEDQPVCVDVDACLDLNSSTTSTSPSSSCFLLSVLPLVKGAVTVSNVLCLESRSYSGIASTFSSPVHPLGYIPEMMMRGDRISLPTWAASAAGISLSAVLWLLLLQLLVLLPVLLFPLPLLRMMVLLLLLGWAYCCSSLGFLDVSGSLTAWLCRQSIASLYKTRQWKDPSALHRSRGIDEGLIHLSQMAGSSSLRALDFLTHLSLCQQPCSAAYYSRVRCVEALLRVPVPLLCLHALDDPVLDSSLLCRVAAAIPKENPNITFAVTEKGGHALFAEDWLLLSRSPSSCYHARVAVEFLEAVDGRAQKRPIHE